MLNESNVEETCNRRHRNAPRNGASNRQKSPIAKMIDFNEGFEGRKKSSTVKE